MRVRFGLEGTTPMSPTAILLISVAAEIERAVSEAARIAGHALTVARTAHEAVKGFRHIVHVLFADLCPSPVVVPPQ